MTLFEKVHAVEQLFQALDAESMSFQKWSGLYCTTGCGKCCIKPDIEATPLEFLPFAYYAYKQNLAFEWLEKLRIHSSELCIFLNPAQLKSGMCTEYGYRGLICRLFGYSARIDKYGKRALVTCQIIKSEQRDRFEEATRRINQEEVVPVTSQYYMRLMAIDQQLARDFYPINEAIKRAIENVLHYYVYRDEVPDDPFPGSDTQR